MFGAAYGLTDFIGKPMARLVSGIPDKIKFLMFSQIPISVPESSESLMVINRCTHLERQMLDILSKRWQTLDLISMMEEFKRSANEEFNKRRYKHTWSSPSSKAFSEDFEIISVKTDSLSSRPRFKKEEELTDCA